ncbi:MAG: glycosyltransferase family 4 protein [Anaerolineae bacterium]|jgi:glycosyltransferase involved in cell wall biosynthesis
MARIAFFTPLSPVQSAIADHAEGLLPLLSRSFDITAITDGSYRPVRPEYRQQGGPNSIPWMDYRAFQRVADQFDLIVYQMGDEPKIHGYMLDALQRYPGLVMLHDLVMHHAILGRTLGQGKTKPYIDEMTYSYGRAGARLAQRVISGQGESLTWELPLVERILDQSMAISAFNGYMHDQVQLLRPGLPVRTIPLPYTLPEGFPADFDGAALRKEILLSERPVVASYGFFIPDKRLGLAFRAIRNLLDRYPDLFYLLVGGAPTGYDLLAQLRAEGLEGHVGLTGWKTQVPFVEHMFVCDVAVHLRWPHIGGTPYTPIRLMGLGIPTIVSDIEPLAEVPADAVVRVTPNAVDEEEQLIRAIDGLLSDRERALAMGAKGRAYVQEHHDLDTIVSSYVEYYRWAIAHAAELKEQVAERTQSISGAEPRPGYRMAVGVCGEALAGLRIAPDDPLWLPPVARAIEGLFAIKGE